MNGIISEIKRLSKSPFKCLILFIIPIIVTVILTLNFSQGVISNVPTALVDLDNTSTSREIIQEFRNNDMFLYKDVSSKQEALKMIGNERTELAVIIPEDFTKNLKNRKSAEVEVISDASNLAYYANGLKKVNEIILTYNSGIKIRNLQGKGFLYDNAYGIVMPAKMNYVKLNNPSVNFVDFLVFGLVVTIIQFAVAMLSVEAASDMKKTRENIKQLLNMWFAFSLLGTIVTIICFIIVLIITPATIKCNMLMLLLLIIMFNLAITAVAILMGTLIPDKLIATKIMMVFCVAALLLSGYTWPKNEFPYILKVLMHIEPLTYYVNTLRPLRMNTISYEDYLFNVLILGIFAIGAFSFSMYTYLKEGNHEAKLEG